MRIYLAWQYITGYSTSGMHALVQQGHDVRLMYQEALVHPPFLAPFDDAELTKGLDAVGWSGHPDYDHLMRELDEFQPDVILFNSWHIGEYMKAARPGGLFLCLAGDPGRFRLSRCAATACS